MASGWSFELDSDNLVASMQGMLEKALPAAARSLFETANVAMGIAKKNCPVAVPEGYPNMSMTQFRKRFTPGALRASGHVRMPMVTGDVVEVELAFGDGAVDYAIYVHEITSYHHVVGEAKFLEKAVNGTASQMYNKLAESWEESL